jgi:hypothetical protein
LLALICLVGAALCLHSMKQKSLTYDEVAYIPAGYSYWATGDFRLNAEHPPLSKLLAGAGARLARPGHSTDLPGFENADQWTFGQVFLLRLGSDLEPLVFWARVPTVLLFVLLVVGTSLFARRLYGRHAGFVGAFLTALSPDLIAHARLATTDLPVTCFTLWALYAFWRYRLRPSYSRLALAAVAAGLAVASKFAALLLLPVLGVWTLVYAGSWPEAPTHLGTGFGGERARRTGAHLLALLAWLLVLVVTVTVTYFDPLDPRAFIASVLRTYPDMTRDYGEYLNGEFSRAGFPEYFAVAFLVKTSLALLVLLGVRAVDEVRSAGEPSSVRRREVHVLLLLAVGGWFAATSLAAIQFGVRYLLPVYPLLIVWVSGLARAPKRSRKLWGAAWMAVLWQGVAALAVHPHYLTYFNEFAGGPKSGIEWLDDSNLDWGQDLIAVRNYLARHPGEDAFITTMTTVPPRVYGIEAGWVTPAAVVNHLDPRSPRPGLHIVSVHVLNRLRFWFPEAAVDPLRDLEPKAILAHTFYVYDVPK